MKEIIKMLVAGAARVIASLTLSNSEHDHEDDIVSLQTAKLASANGYKKRIKTFYHSGWGIPSAYNDGRKVNWNARGHISAPTQSQLHKWIRKNRQLNVIVQNVTIPRENLWMYEIHRLPRGKAVIWNKDSEHFESYEKAMEAGLRRALELKQPE